MDSNNNPGANQQNHPHREGQMNNTTPQEQGNGQRVSENNARGLGDMLNESSEQKAGRAHGQQNESDVQQEQRQP